jgi:hypothetical protein
MSIAHRQNGRNDSPLSWLAQHSHLNGIGEARPFGLEEPGF